MLLCVFCSRYCPTTDVTNVLAPACAMLTAKRNAIGTTVARRFQRFQGKNHTT